jgi:hypothetical protein
MNALEMLEAIIAAGPAHRNPEVLGHISKSSGQYNQNKRIEFENGGSISVQASEFTYCTPRDNTGPYVSVEVGFPEGVHIPDSWESHADYWPRDDDDKTWRDSQVFGWVPVERIRELILANCPKLAAAMLRADRELMTASERKDWFDTILR